MNGRIYAQSVDNIVNLIGGKDVGLPLPDEFLRNSPNIENVDITDLTIKPKVGDYCKDGIFYTTEEWYNNYVDQTF